MDKPAQMIWIQLSSCYRQPWDILVIQALVLSLCSHVGSIFSLKLPDVHWNKTNPMFKTSNNDHVVEVNINDEINFVCPYYSRDSGLDPQHHEYYIIHRVTKLEYDSCNIDPESSPVAIIDCNMPSKKLFYTLTFRSFLPIPNAIEFKKGETYYFISTSTGDVGGLNNTYRGACYKHKMKLTIKVCCDQTIDNTTDPTPQTISSTTSLDPSVSTSTVTTTTTTSTTTTTRGTTPTIRHRTTTLRASTLSSSRRTTKSPPTIQSSSTTTTLPGGDGNKVDDETVPLPPNNKAVTGSATLCKYSLTLIITGLLFTLKCLQMR